MKATTFGLLGFLFFAVSCKKSLQESEDAALQTVTNKSKAVAVATATTIQFSGYTWTVKNSGTELYGPGPNIWNSQNVWVDANGWLHLKLSKNTTANQWECAEVQSTQTFGYGTYEWQVQGAVNALDKQVVLGLFNYSGTDGLDEMDIEFARWGVATNLPLNYTVYPAKSSGRTFHTTSDFTMSGTYTTHRFIRSSSSVVFKSLGGFQSDDTNLFKTATCNKPYVVSTKAMPVYMNLWLFQGIAPSNNSGVEIVIHNFKYTP